MNKLRFQNLRQRLVFVQESTIVVVNKEGNIGLRHLLKIRKIFDGKLTGLIEIVSSLTLSLETNSIGQTIRVIAKIVITSMINSNDARRAGNQNGNQCHIFVTSQGTMKRNLRENTGLKSKEPVNCILLTGNGPHFQRVDSRIKNINARREIVPLRIFVRRVINQISLTPNDIRMVVLNDTRIEILHYTQFKYSDLKIEQENHKVKISFKIKNIGTVKGKEIAQIYVSQLNPKIYKPLRELKEFKKVELKPGEEKIVKIELAKDSFEYYNTELKKWAIEEDKYEIQVGKSSEDIVLKDRITIKSQDAVVKTKYSDKYYNAEIQEITDKEFEKVLGRKIPERHLKIDEITEENTLEQIKETNIGKVIYNSEIEKMNRLSKEQNVNKATKVMMDLQKPLKKFYEKHNSKITKEMVDELLDIVKNNKEYANCKFLEIYLK